MNTCSTCKHWKPPDDPYYPDEDEERSFREVYGTCKVAESSNGKPITALQPSCAMDSSGYHASLGTLSTFGCVLHEERA